ncbi:MAG: response regulator transcription factor [Clostridia bacterium]|nr:response regulator transcription factor [Clostridia bacterium]
MKILLVEDNESVAKALKYSLEQENFIVLLSENLNIAKQTLNTEKVDLIILDISLPDGNGMEFYCNKLKKLEIPTIFLTAKDDEENIVNGLENGAEDYITKPFKTKELIARINKIFLRKNKNTIVKIKDIEFDLDKMVVTKSGNIIEFTGLEIKILNLLFNNLNKVVSRESIIDKIWEWTGNDVNDNTVTVYLKRIRHKLETDIIITVKGIGYRIDSGE